MLTRSARGSAQSRRIASRENRLADCVCVRLHRERHVSLVRKQREPRCMHVRMLRAERVASRERERNARGLLPQDEARLANLARLDSLFSPRERLEDVRKRTSASPFCRSNIVELARVLAERKMFSRQEGERYRQCVHGSDALAEGNGPTIVSFFFFPCETRSNARRLTEDRARECTRKPACMYSLYALHFDTVFVALGHLLANVTYHDRDRLPRLRLITPIGSVCQYIDEII